MFFCCRREKTAAAYRHTSPLREKCTAMAKKAIFSQKCQVLFALFVLKILRNVD